MRKIIVTDPFRQGRRIYRAGVYRVPQDMPEAVADRAVKERRATDVGPVPGVEMPAMAAVAEDEFLRIQGGAKSKRRRKGPAPENKAVEPAEDKDAVRDDPAAMD